MLIYAQEEYGFSLSLKNVILPKIEKKKAENSVIMTRKSLSHTLRNI